MHISVIVPTFQASKFINLSIEKIVNYLDSTNLEYEVIFVDDGSSDDTLLRLNGFKDNSHLKILASVRNEGKFSAISKGVKVAVGDVLVFTDADLPYELEVIDSAYKLITSQDIPIVVGDRRHRSSVADVQITYTRRLFSFILSIIIKALITGKRIDSQCGFKAFKAQVAKEIFPLLKCRRFAGDIEILYIVLKHDLRIDRIPVRFVNNNSSTVKKFSDFVEFLLCILLLKLNWKRNLYTSPNLKVISKKERDPKDLASPTQ
jgi:dolichyl-phosphate beta-glucosyltransferase